MNKFSSIGRDEAVSMFHYDDTSGNLIWKPRPRMVSVNTRFAGKVAGHRHTCTVGKTYIQVRVNGALQYAHRIVWVITRGEIPDGMQVDHIDGDGTNNRLANLRLVTDSENKRNQRKMATNTTGYTGVYFDKRRKVYYARAWLSNRAVNLGTASTAEEAYELRVQFNRENGFHENHGMDRPL